MNSLFLSPRYDLFRIALPKELIPDQIYEKWSNIINKYNKNYFRDPIDIINESIQGISITGISDGGVESQQNSWNEETGRIEPIHTVTYNSSGNPISKLSNELTITFRHEQGFYNYFLLFETWFWLHSKKYQKDIPMFVIEVLGEDGVVLNHIQLKFPIFISMDELSLSYNKVERGSDTFNCSFKYSDIDFEFGPYKSDNEI